MVPAGVRNAVVAVLAVLLSALVAASPWPPLAVRAPRWSAVIETTLVVVGGLVVLLCVGRVRRYRRLGDVAVAASLVLLAIGAPVGEAVAAVVHDEPLARIAVLLAAAAQVGGAALLLVASAPALYGREYRSSWRWWARTAIPVAGLLVLLTVVFGVVAHRNVLRVLDPTLAQYPHPLANPFVALIQLISAVLFAMAAAQLTRLATGRGDTFLGWLGTGCILSAVACIDYAMFPVLNIDWVHAGDLFRAGAVAAWAVGAVTEISSYWSEIGRLARAEERRELARDLHDGLAQEISFLATQVKAPADVRARPEWLSQVQAAAERALAESRRAITILTADNAPPLEADLVTTTEVIAAQTGAKVGLQVSGPPPAPDRQEAIIRIVREAVLNATRHGQATRVDVELVEAGDRRLRVSDNGIGFDVGTERDRSRGFGLISMEERAEAVGGTFTVRSAPGAGTTVEVAWT